MTNEMRSSYNQFLFHRLLLLYMFRTNLVVHHQEHCLIYCITQYNRYNLYNRAGESSCYEVVGKSFRQLHSSSTRLPDCTKLPDTLYYAVLLTMNEFETCRARKNCGIKIVYKNCASRWSSTHCNMMHGTHNVTLTHCNMMHGTHNVTLTHCNMMHGTHNVKLKWT
jgi:hypothetical protein